MTKLAKTICFLFSGATLGPINIFLASKLAPSNIPFFKVLGLSLFFVFFIPAFFYLIFLKKGLISDFDITKKEERPKIHLVVLISVLLFLLVCWALGEKALVYFYLKIIFPFFAFALITLFWKISFHALMNTLFILLLYLNTNNPAVLYMGVFLLFLVFWAKLKINHHTLSQLLAGALLPFLILV